MKNFSEYFLLKEAASENSVEMAFSDAENKVKEIFAYLGKLMQNTWGKQAPAWDSQVKGKVIADLQGVIEKLKGNIKQESYSEAKRLVKESIILEASPSWIQDSISKNRTITVDRMLQSMQNQVIKILHSLRDELLVKSVEKVGTRISKNIGSKVKGIGQDIQNQISGGVKVHPEISGSERSTGKYNLVRLFNALQSRPDIRLYSGSTGTRQLKFNPNNELEVANILDKINKGKSFRVRIGNKDHFFDITDEGDTNRILELIASHEI